MEEVEEGIFVAAIPDDDESEGGDNNQKPTDPNTQNGGQIRDDETGETTGELSFDFIINLQESWAAHYAAYAEYVKYTVGDFAISVHVDPLDTIIYENGFDETLGDVYSYDEGDFIYFSSYGQNFNDEFLSMSSMENADDMAALFKEFSDAQLANGTLAEVEQFAVISVQALQDALLSSQFEDVLGLPADVIYQLEMSLDKTVYYTINADGSYEVLPVPKDPAAWWEKLLAITIGAVLIIGAVFANAIPGVGPLICGAMIGAAVSFISQVAIGGTSFKDFNWASFTIDVVTGFVSGAIPGAGSGLGKLVTNAVTKKLGSVITGKIVGLIAKFAVTALLSAGINFVGQTVNELVINGFQFSKINWGKIAISSVVSGAMAGLSSLMGSGLEKLGKLKMTNFQKLLFKAFELGTTAAMGGLTGGVLTWLSGGDWEAIKNAFVQGFVIGAAVYIVSAVGQKIASKVKAKINANKQKDPNLTPEQQEKQQQIDTEREQLKEIGEKNKSNAKTEKKLHGNDLRNQKETWGYEIRHTETGELLKFGETTRGFKRYTNKWYTQNSAEMVPILKGSKYAMHQWQHEQILNYINNHGNRPPFNFNNY